MTTNEGNYREEPADDFDRSIDEWLELSYSAQYYHYNKDDQIDYNERIRERNRQFLKELKEKSSCSKCDESHPATLDFHHLSDKTMTVSQMSLNGHSIESLKNEISKCEIICSNCHRKLHWSG